MGVRLLATVVVVAALIPSPAAADDCSTCHGSALNAAPPVDVSGNSATTFTGVGAHQAHLGASSWHAPIACNECHIVPSSVDDPGHTDTPLPAELVWGPLATGEGASPNWDGTSCSGVYCHGATLPGGGASPVWTSVGSGQAACGTCHDVTMGGMHACSDCHADIDADMTFNTPSQHIDGVVTLFPVTGVHGDGPVALVLRQNVPNPFNPTTRISYALTTERHVQLAVYDVTGDVVAVLANGVQGPGEHEAQWDAGGLPSGIYFCRLSASGHTVTKKMVLLK